MPIELKKSVIYGGRREEFVETEDSMQPEIELNASVKFHRIAWNGDQFISGLTLA
jgi:hypothetical protein